MFYEDRDNYCLKISLVNLLTLINLYIFLLSLINSLLFSYSLNLFLIKCLLLPSN